MNWNRFSISLLIILMSLPALYFYMLFILNMLSPDNPISYHWTSYLVLISSVLAWMILFIMALLWSRERVIPKWLATLAVLLAIIGLTDRKSTRLNSSHVKISYAVFCLKKKND